MYNHILLPTDGSKLASKAVKQGIALAHSIDAKITILNVAPVFQVMIDEGFVIPNAMSFKKRFDEETSRHANTIVESIQTNALKAGVVCETLIARNDRPYEAILQAAGKTKCDLIMMASHGRKGLASILLGSETIKVLAHSKIPVLVVR